MKSRAAVLASLLLVSACSNGPGSLRASPESAVRTTRPAEAPSGRPSLRAPEEPWWTAGPTAPAAQTVTPREPIDTTFVFNGDVLFDIGSAELSPAAASQLGHLVELAMQYPAADIEIVGHTDNTPGPTASFNDDLSHQRAASVQAWLTDAGVSDSRIGIDGRGATEPIASNATDAGRATNRRVAVTIRGSDG